MTIYHQLGEVPPKRHVAFRNPEGVLYHEQLIGNFGFAGPSSLLYHLRPPTSVKSTRLIGSAAPLAAEPGELKLRHFRTEELPPQASPTLDRTPLLFNEDVLLSHVVASGEDPHFFRNGGADELIFVARGQGLLESTFGELAFAQGDQLVIPRGTIYRLKMSSADLRLFVIESRGFLRTPERYRTAWGQLKEGAPFSERSLKRPTSLPVHDETGDFNIVVKQRDALTELVLDHHPFDVVGWDGFYYPWSINIRDFEPIVGAIHQPPPVHQVLESDQLVYCNFCPRPFDFHEGAVPAPYNHSNVMSDEVLIYVSEEFMSRKGISYGSITLHPDGLPHGPHPGLYEASIGRERTEEYALMLDTFKPLNVAQSATPIEDAQYHTTWRGDHS